MTQRLALIAVGTMLTVASPATAQTTFFGENLTPGATATGQPVAARNSFLSSLSGVSTESFESFAEGTSPTTLNFTGSAGNIAATFAPGGGSICASNGCGGSGRFATDGTHYFDVSSSNFSIAFSQAIAAFGFYGTDIGDISGRVTLTLLRAGGNTTLTVPNTLNGPDGSLLFYGVIDTANPFTGIQFGNTAAGADFFGFDQLTIGDVRQVVPVVPEPASWAMMILGMGAVGGVMRRRGKVVTRVSYA